MPIYKGMIEFMKLSDWHDELAVLVDEVCTEADTVYAMQPRESDEMRSSSFKLVCSLC